MKPSIYFKNIWSDDDMIELKITVDDGNSQFTNKVYVGYQQLEQVLKILNMLREQAYGGIANIEFGEFGPKYANSAFCAQIHFSERGKIYISIRMQSEYFNFGASEVASEVHLYLLSEPALLDNFIDEFKIIKEIESSVRLECIEF